MPTIDPATLNPPILIVPVLPEQTRPSDGFYGTLAMRQAWDDYIGTTPEDAVRVIAFGATSDEATEMCKLASFDGVLHPDNEYNFEAVAAPFRAAMLDEHPHTFLVMPPESGRRPCVHEYVEGTIILEPLTLGRTVTLAIPVGMEQNAVNL